MLKMRDKRSALRIIYKAGDEIIKLLEEKGMTEGVVGRGELSNLLNINERRGKDLFTMALQFAACEIIRTPRWEMKIMEPDKPVVYMRNLSKIKTKNTG